MKRLTFYIMIIVISSILGCQVGCGGDDAEDIEYALTEQQYADIEAETRQYLYENADWNVRMENAKKARKRYFKLKKMYPNAALNAYIEYQNWFYYGHPLATEIAKLNVKMDMAGKSNISDTLQLLEWELQVAKDREHPKEHIDEFNEEILFWTELAKELVTEGEDPAEFIIAFAIQEAIEWE